MRTLPRKPPTMDLTDGVGVRVEDLGIAVFTEVQGRQVRLVDTSLSMTAGIDMNYETTTGFLGIGVDLSRGVNASVDVNEYRPDDDAEIEEALAGLMASPLISGAISAALGGLGVNMPSFALGEEFYGLEDMSIEIAGDEQDWIGAYTWLGPVPYESAGGCAGGCGDSGCDDSGCTDAAGCEDSGCTDKKGGCDPDALSDTSSCKGSDPYGTSDCGSCDSKKSSCDKGCSSASGALNGRILAVVFALVLVSLRRRRDD
jgi:hypothetical protein